MADSEAAIVANLRFRNKPDDRAVDHVTVLSLGSPHLNSTEFVDGDCGAVLDIPAVRRAQILPPSRDARFGNGEMVL